MNKKKCQFCEQYFELLKLAKQETDKDKKKKLQDDMRGYKPTIRFYYPILDRDKEMASILQTALSVRLKIEKEHENGIDVLAYDYILTRTEKPGSDYYTLTRLDSQQAKPLTNKEKGEIKNAKTWNLEELVGGRKSSLNVEEVKEIMG